MLSVHMVEGEPMPADGRGDAADVRRRRRASTSEIREAGAWVFGGGLHPADTATAVKVADGEVLLTDGPFAETKEQLGGFWIIEAADLDAALAWAAKATVACQGPVEVRPFQDEPERSSMTDAATGTVERVFREESGRAVATLIRLFGDIDIAEEAVQDAFLVAAESWPADGRAAQPGRVDRDDRAQPRHRPLPARVVALRPLRAGRDSARAERRGNRGRPLERRPACD